MSQLGEVQAYQNEGMFVTASGDHSINAETTDNVSLQNGEEPANIVEVPSTSVETNRDLVV